MVSVHTVVFWVTKLCGLIDANLTNEQRHATSNFRVNPEREGICAFENADNRYVEDHPVDTDRLCS